MTTPANIPSNRFPNGAAYAASMGQWSRLAGTRFLDWLALPAGLGWLDVGCGSGAFTRLVLESAAPTALAGIDPSAPQLAFAREDLAGTMADLREGDAMALPWPDSAFDVAAMALVLFFVPEPQTAVNEMARVVRPGGTVASYSWDMANGGAPFQPIAAELEALGGGTPQTQVEDTDRLATLTRMWAEAGLDAVETTRFTVERPFADFEEYWVNTTRIGRLAANVAALAPADLMRVKERVRERLGAPAGGPMVAAASANAVKGRLPG